MRVCFQALFGDGKALFERWDIREKQVWDTLIDTVHLGQLDAELFARMRCEEGLPNTMVIKTKVGVVEFAERVKMRLTLNDAIAVI